MPLPPGARRHAVWLLAFVALLVGRPDATRAQERAEPARLVRIQVLDAPHATAIHVHLEGEPAGVSTIPVEDPPHLVVRIRGAVNATGSDRVAVGSPRASEVRIESGDEPAEVRLVVLPGDAADPFRSYGLSPTESGILLTVGVGEVTLRPEAAPPGPAPTEPAPPRTVEQPAQPEPPPAPRPIPTPPPTPPEPDLPARTEMAQEDLPTRAPLRSDGLAYPVGEVRVQYASLLEGQPHLSELHDLEVPLLRTPQGWVAPREGLPVERVRIGRPGDAPTAPYYGSAIRALNQAIVDEFNRRGLVGVLALPHEQDIDPRSSRDLRPPGRTTLRLVVWTGRLLEYRTFASGDRIPQQERIDHPAHRRIVEQSPIQPGELLNENELEDYVARLNRHPGRNVDVALTRAGEPGGVYLDFLVAESKPWSAYAQLSNTGTPETTRLRERFGFVHRQLTGRDDILNLDYVTGDFDEVHAALGSYEIPFRLGGGRSHRLRWRVDGSWSQFDASEVGSQDFDFEGEAWHVGTQLVANLFQHRDLFVDLFAGARYQHVDNDNEVVFPGQDVSGTANFFLPEAGLQIERDTEESTLMLGVSGEMNLAGVAGTRTQDLAGDSPGIDAPLGRPAVTETDFAILRWQATGSFFLEPLLSPGYDDPTTPGSSTLAHELFFHSRGQYTQDRLIPYHQGIAGGLHSIRGYSQSSTAADTVVLTRSEYRLHIPRLLPLRPTPATLPLIGEFRVAPNQVYGRPDWDLILRGFADWGWVKNNDARIGEKDRDQLLGVGAGLELRFLSNLIARFDWGHALTTAGDDEAGNNEYHFSVTLVY